MVSTAHLQMKFNFGNILSVSEYNSQQPQILLQVFFSLKEMQRLWDTERHLRLRMSQKNGEVGSVKQYSPVSLLNPEKISQG